MFVVLGAGLFLLASCDQIERLWPKDETSQKIVTLTVTEKKKPKSKTVTETKSDAKNSIQQKGSCGDHLKSQAEIIKSRLAQSGGVWMQIESDRILSEADLVSWLMEFVPQFYNDWACAGDAFEFVVLIDETELLAGQSRLNDWRLLKEKRISRAEWIRRLDLQRSHTVTALKAKLFEAREQKNNDEALRLVDEILQKESFNLEVMLIKGNVLFEKKQFEDAQAVYKKILDRDPKNSLALFHLAIVQKKRGLFANAIVLLKSLESVVAQNSTLIEHNLWALHLMDAYLKNNDLDAATAFSNVVLEAKDPLGRVLVANLKRAKQDQQGAIVLLESAPQDGSSLAKLALFNLILNHLDRKEIEPALKYHALLKEMAPSLANELSFLQRVEKDPVDDEITPPVKVIDTDSGADDQEALF